MLRKSLFLLLCWLAHGGLVWGHKPSYSEGRYGQRTASYEIADVDVSIVLYHKVTCDNAQLWMKFSLSQPREVFVQLGIPDLPRLKSYRPSLALVARGLPKATQSLPFAVPSGYGVKVFDTSDVQEPKQFDEPFSRTTSWILFEQKVALPEAGEGYIVAWHPARQTGKLWVAVGEKEEFGQEDFKNFRMWMDKTQEFHETGEYIQEEPKEKVCKAAQPAQPSDQSAAAQPPAPPVGSGCSVLPTVTRRPGWSWLGMLLWLVFARRRTWGAEGI